MKLFNTKVQKAKTKRLSRTKILLGLSVIGAALLYTLVGGLTYASGPYNGPHGNDVFVMLVKTDNAGSSANNQFMIPTTGAGYNYSVDCNNDGVFEATGRTGNYTCSYDSPGTYSVVIDGTFRRVYFNDDHDKLKLLEVQQWGDTQWTTMHKAFFGAANMQLTASDNPDLSNVTDLYAMFTLARSFNQDISDWDVSNVTSMGFMFREADSFNYSLNGWDVSKVTSMNRMFDGADSFNQPLDEWDVSAVTSMSQMFVYATSFNQPLNDWNVSEVKNMSGMFQGAASFNQPLDEWDTSAVTNMSSMFEVADSFNQDISKWEVGSVTSMAHMFNSALVFDQDISDWDVSNVTTFRWMFRRNNAFNQDISGWDVSSATLMDGMFERSPFNQDISSWDVSSVTNITSMFRETTDFNQDISSWDVSSVTSMSRTFESAYSFNQDISDWDMTSVTDASYMLGDSGISSETYDAILDGWSEQNLQNGVRLDAYGKAYCTSAVQRQYIIDTYNWTINDSGHGCSLPQVVTGGVVTISDKSAIVEIDIIDSGGTLSSAGVQFGANTDYTWGNYDADSYEQGIQLVSLNGLGCETTYHYRAYASNGLGTGYGSDATFTTGTCPESVDLGLGITLAPPGLIQGQEARYTFTTTNVSNDINYEEDSVELIIVVPDSMELAVPYDEDNGMYSDGETYACYDYTGELGGMPAFAYHLGVGYYCSMLIPDLSPGESYPLTLPFAVNGPVDEQTTIRALVVTYPENDMATIEDAFYDIGDIFALPINNIAIYTGTLPGTTIPIPDPEQDPNTASLASSENGKPIRLETPAGTEINCSSTAKESSLTTQDSAYHYPLGLVDFCFTTTETDNEVSLTFMTNLEPDEVKARKYNPIESTYSDITGATITQTTYAGQPALRLTYVITDNGSLDLDPVTGQIKDPVGLAVLGSSSLADTGTSLTPYILAASTLIVVSICVWRVTRTRVYRAT